MDLPEVRARYEDLRAAFEPTSEHFVPDIVLLGFLNEIEENVRAVEILADSVVPHRAFPNARAAFEGAQRALLLTTADDYDLAGGKAWLYYLRRDKEYMAQERSGPVPKLEN